MGGDHPGATSLAIGHADTAEKESAQITDDPDTAD